MRKIPTRMIVTSVALVCAASAISLEAYSVMNGVPHWFIPTTYVAPATSNEVAAWLMRLGFTPENLAAAGVSEGQTTSLVAAVRGYVSQNIAALRSADAAVATARKAAGKASQQLQSGKAGADGANTLATASSTLAAAQATLDAMTADLRAAAQSGLSDGQVALLAQFSQAREYEVPVAYAATNRSESDWVKTRDALANQRHAQAAGLDVAEPVATQISALDAEAAVINAKAALASNKAAVEAAWNSALASH